MAQDHRCKVCDSPAIAAFGWEYCSGICKRKALHPERRENEWDML